MGGWQHGDNKFDTTIWGCKTGYENMGTTAAWGYNNIIGTAALRDDYVGTTT